MAAKSHASHQSKPAKPTDAVPKSAGLPAVKTVVTYHQKPSHRLRWAVLAVLGLIGLALALTHYALTQTAALTSVHLAQHTSPPITQTFDHQVAWPSAIPWPTHSTASTHQEEALLTDPTVVSRSKFGHLPYREADSGRLMVIASYSQRVAQRFEQMHHEAGLALMKMIDAARLDGVWLVPVSGFRDFDRQEDLFNAQAELVGSTEGAARSVAPPGYSEHHTGYAIDLADGLARAKDLSLAFGQTEAFQWLMAHAQEFGFELSFPENNAQGVMYEPWHWRFVNSPSAAGTFALARGTREVGQTPLSQTLTMEGLETNPSP